MTEQEQRVAIAEVCGWKEIVNADGNLSEPHLTRTWTEWIGPNGQQDSEPPDFLHDLNAMHKAEKQGVMKMEGFFRAYVDYLVRITGRINGGVDATAAQRSEAFCRVMWPEKWKK